MQHKHLTRFLTALLALSLLFTLTAFAEGTRSFVDDAGREVTLPEELTRIAPSGTVAQLLLYSFDEARMVGLARNFTKAYPAFFSEALKGLPEFGQFYGKNASLNLEALIAASPQAIIDMGEKKKTIVEDMDGVSAQTGIPTLFIEATLETLPQAYRRLGVLLNNEARGGALAAYAEEALQLASENLKKIEKPVTVYVAMGKDGLSTNARNSFHAEVLRLVGADNVIEDNPATTGGATEVSLELLMTKDPAFILVDGKELAEMIKADPAWQGLSAVKEGRLAVIPSMPFNFLFNPPTMNRVIGLYWLGNLLYPELYQVDIREKVKDFYALYLNYELSDEQLAQVLGQ